MSFERRRALLEWADRHYAAIVEDDYDSEFRFRARPIEPLRTLDASGRVIYIGSFSKTMLPTIRLGFVVTPRSLRPAMLRAKEVADWHTPIPLQAALAQFIDKGGFSRHVRKMRENYRVRREMVIESLTSQFSDHLEVVPSIAGLHVTALARTASAEEISQSFRGHLRWAWKFRIWRHLLLLLWGPWASCWDTGRFPPPTSKKVCSSFSVAFGQLDIGAWVAA